MPKSKHLSTLEKPNRIEDPKHIFGNPSNTISDISLRNSKKEWYKKMRELCNFHPYKGY